MSIDPRGRSFGRCAVRQFKMFNDAGDPYPRLVEQEMLIDLAGAVAEKEMTGSISKASLGSDFLESMELALRLRGDWRQAIIYLGGLWTITEDTFRLPPVNAAVHALAQRLLERRELSGRSAIRVIRQALGPA